jgi:hypothetical protein
MCCYVRHLKGPLAKAGLPDDLDGRREADRRIRAGLGLSEADCPDVWRTVKALDLADVLRLMRTGA